ncbi:MAG: hypothetical protein EOM12_14195 [Verrucomicrobiae bacterium]|nr:hypothetical protein [Verrucomicrobiae bacterium]
MDTDVLDWVVQDAVQNKTAKIGAKQQTLQRITCIATESTSQIPVYLRPSASSAVKTFPAKDSCPSVFVPGGLTPRRGESA